MVTITHDHQARRRSYELLAAEFGARAQGRVKRSQFLVRPSRGRDMYLPAGRGRLGLEAAKAASRVSPLRCPFDFHLPSVFLCLKSKPCADRSG